MLNNTHHAAIRDTPSKLLLGYDQRAHDDHKLREEIDRLIEIDHDIVEKREAARDVALQVSERLRDYNKRYYDSRYRKPSQYRIGEFVLVRDLRVKPGVNNKLKPSYKGPYRVAKVLGSNRYVVQDIPGFNLTPQPFNSILSSDKMKPWVKNGPIETKK